MPTEPTTVNPSLLFKIGVTGQGSTGKTTLVHTLAHSCDLSATPEQLGQVSERDAIFGRQPLRGFRHGDLFAIDTPAIIQGCGDRNLSNVRDRVAEADLIIFTVDDNHTDDLQIFRDLYRLLRPMVVVYNDHGAFNKDRFEARVEEIRDQLRYELDDVNDGDEIADELPVLRVNVKQAFMAHYKNNDALLAKSGYQDLLDKLQAVADELGFELE